MEGPRRETWFSYKVSYPSNKINKILHSKTKYKMVVVVVAILMGYHLSYQVHKLF